MFRRLRVLYLKIRSDGFVSAMKWLMITLDHRLIPQKQIIWCADLTEMDSKGFSMPDNFNIQRIYSIDQVDKEDLKTLIECGTELMGSAASSLIRERFDKGAVLWLLKKHGRLAGYRWTISNNHVTPTYVPHTEKDVHTIGVEILPNFRGRDLFALFQTSSQIIMKNDGAKRHFSETYLWNTRAVKSFFNTNTRKIGVATRFSFIGKNVVIWNDMTGKTDFS